MPASRSRTRGARRSAPTCAIRTSSSSSGTERPGSSSPACEQTRTGLRADGAEALADEGGRVDAGPAVLLQTGEDDRVELRWQAADPGRRAGRRGVQLLEQDVAVGEGRAAGEQLEQGAADRVQVGAAIDVGA